MMLRPAVGAVSRGITASSRRLGAAVPRRGGRGIHPSRRHLTTQKALTTLRTSVTPAVVVSASSTAGGDEYASESLFRLRCAALVAGSALGLWAITAPENKSAASCSSSEAMEVAPPRRRHEADLANPANNNKADAGAAGAKKVAAASAAAAAAAVAAQPHAMDAASGVDFVVASTYNGNGPIEDRHDIRQSPHGDFFASVYDGHGGWQAAELARKRLNIAAQAELKHSLAANPDQVKGALTQAFLRVEREYLYQVKAAFDLGFGAVARTGACAIMALVRDRHLFVANAGDCRAVLGRRARRVRGWVRGGGEKEVMEAVALSNDHNAREETEQAKLRKLHPFESDVFTCKRANSCYVKGRLQPTRSLGDAYLKYPEFNGTEGTHRSAGRFLPPPYTPPYITAEPEISVHKIDRSHDDFVVLASDGLWDHVNNDEAVEIVRVAAYEDGDPESAGDRLIKCVLERAAKHHGLSVQELQEVPEGSTRRNMHDDITCVVFFLKGDRNTDGFGSLQSVDAQDVDSKTDSVAPAQ